MSWCEDPTDSAEAAAAGFLRLAAVVLFACGVVWAQDDARDVLLKVRRAVMKTVEGLPKYVCTQTIDRARYEPDPSRFVPGNNRHRIHSCDGLAAEVNSAAWKRQLTSSDRLRLDVAVTHSQPGLDSEMYSWAGEDHFGDRDLFEMIHDGAVSSGSFSAMLASILGGEAANFSYNGDRNTIGGKLLSEFGFHVPLEKSHYSYVLGTNQGRQVPIEYGGSVLADPETSDLVRLVVRASHLPEESSTCEITQTLDYKRISLHGAEFLLPAEARISTLHTDGSQAENVIHYSACHEFLGESTVHFAALPASDLPAPANDVERPALSLPSGLPFTLVFTERIDTSEAAAGDRIRGKLKTAIRDRSARVVIPEGAGVSGRIVNIRHFYGPVKQAGNRAEPGLRPSLVMKVILETIELGGRSYPIRARYDAGTGRFMKVPGGMARRVELGSADRLEESDIGEFDFFDSNPDRIVTAGVESSWVTAP
jgi:hypothetical protein